MLAGELLPANQAPRCKSLIPLGGRTSLAVATCPYFTVRGQMARQLEHLATHGATLWQRQLQRPLHAFPALDFLSGFYPRQDGGGGGGSGLITGPRGDLGAYRCMRLGKVGTRQSKGRREERRRIAADEGWARTQVHGRPASSAWGAIVLALSGDGPRSRQLLLVWAHRPP